MLGLADNPDGIGNVEALANFMTNPAGSAIVNALGQIRPVVSPGAGASGDKHRYLVIAPQVSGRAGAAVQVQSVQSL